jgi:glycosyltransferase involved in cell wall biosynthesis
MKRFVSVHPFLEHGGQQRHIGRLVANHDFARALLTYGTWDEYVFSGPSATNLRTFSETVTGWGLPPERQRQISVVSFPELRRRLGSDRFDAMHVGGWGYFMPGLHYLRSAAGGNHWPITGVTFSLHGRDTIDHAVRLAHAGMSGRDAVFCISRDGREAMRRLLDGAAAIAGRTFEGDLIEVPLGIDDASFEARGDRARARARLRIPDEAVVLLTLGRMTPSQKMDLGPWLRAFARRIRPASRRPVCLVLAGGASPNDLRLVKETIDRHGIGDAVRLHANFPEEGKADLLALADVLVSPVDNTQETFGLSLVEGMAAGLPVVASRYDGYKDIVRDGIDGFLIDTIGLEADPAAEWFHLLDQNLAQLLQSQTVAIDLEQCADRVLTLVHDDALRARMGRNAFERADGHFRISRMIARYEALWAELADRPVPATDRAARNPWSLDPGRVFGHYVSSVLADDLVVEAAPSGQDEAPYGDVAVFLPLELVPPVLETAARPERVGTLRARFGAGVPAFDFLLVWLLKYGVLRRR